MRWSVDDDRRKKIDFALTRAFPLLLHVKHMFIYFHFYLAYFVFSIPQNRVMLIDSAVAARCHCHLHPQTTFYQLIKLPKIILNKSLTKHWHFLGPPRWKYASQYVLRERVIGSQRFDTSLNSRAWHRVMRIDFVCVCVCFSLSLSISRRALLIEIVQMQSYSSSACSLSADTQNRKQC